MDEKEKFLQLLQGYLDHTLLPREQDQFFAYVKQPIYRSLLESAIDQKMQQPQLLGPHIYEQRLKEIEKNILRANQPKTFRLWKRWMVAASISIILGVGLYYTLRLNDKTLSGTAASHASIEAPTSSRAKITMDDGRVVYLDSADNGQLAIQGPVRVLKLDDGAVAYEVGAKELGRELSYHTLTNPRGSKVVSMTLSDGTEVWLNAGSSITYPVVFKGAERRVELMGEGYFEVAHNPSKPFYVSKGAATVKVLGTHFNVTAYDEEGIVKVTLLEGSVQVSHRVDNQSGNAHILEPGQQATFRLDKETIAISQANIHQAIAWKDGRFDFQDIDFKTAMKQIERWYDIEVVYKSTVPDIVFFGDMDRNTSMDGVIQLLEVFGVSAHLDGKKLIIE